MTPSTLVAHPHVQHSLRLSLGLQQRGLLDAHLTRYYLSSVHPPFSYMRWLPESILSRMLAVLEERFSRSLAQLDVDSVKVVSPTRTFAGLALQRLAPEPLRGLSRLLLNTTDQFQRKAARLAIERQVACLICYDCFAHTAFSLLEQEPVLRVLDLSATHPATYRRLLIEEEERWPQFAGSLTLTGITDDAYWRAVEEPQMADLILAGSSWVRESCIENGVSEEKIRVVPYGIDTRKFDVPMRDDPSGPLKVLFVGQITQRKGIAYLLEAMRLLDTGSATLTLCGTMLTNPLALKPYENHFEYRGYVPHSQIQNLYAEFDVLVLPSLGEGMSQVCLEAMASGLPVIATTNSGLKGILQHGEEGFLIPIRSIEAIAEHIEFFCRNRNDVFTMGRAARAKAARYTWQRYYTQVADVVEAALQPSARESVSQTQPRARHAERAAEAS